MIPGTDTRYVPYFTQRTPEREARGSAVYSTCSEPRYSTLPRVTLRALGTLTDRITPGAPLRHRAPVLHTLLFVTAPEVNNILKRTVRMQ